MQKLNKVLNGLVIISLVFLIGKGIYDNKVENDSNNDPKYDFLPTLNDVVPYYPDADSLSLEDVSLYYVFDDEELIGKTMNTSPYSDKIYGYNGTVPMTIFLDEDDEIIDILACDNKETRNYMNRVERSGLLDEWDDLSPEEVVDKQVDALSGCTFTSKAIIKSVQTRMAVFTDQENSRFSWDWSLFARQLLIIITMVMALICFFKQKNVKVLRKITLLLSIIILGFWTNSLLSLSLFYSWIANGISLSVQIPIVIIALLAIILPLLTKKSFYCQYLCPFGAMQEFAGDIRGKKVTISAKMFKILSVVRRVILLTLLFLIAFGVGLDLSQFEPFPVFNFQSIAFGTVVFAAVILVASIFFNKPWCNYFCPTGTLLEIFRRRK